MNITVRVASAQALAQLKAAEAQIAAMERQLNRGSGAAAGFSRAMNGMNLVKWGSQMQWVGRQIQYNFTLPIIAAAGFATKFALDNEKAFTRVAKVYGDGTQSASVLKNELNALRKNFVALSNRFGIAQKDAINIAGDWAAAGSSGIALAKAVELTMKTMALGEIEAKTATQALIAIQAQYRLSTEQLTSTIYQLNQVENQTGISLAGLIEGFARAAGTAKAAGVDTRHLAAMLAALTPAAGSAAQAGNALKTIFSRLLSPTKEANQVLGLMGIHMTDAAWKSANATQRLMIMAKANGALSSSQKLVVSTVIASRYQINKFSVLMDELISQNGYYQKALNATSSASMNAIRAQAELNTILDSSPQRLKIIWTMFQNSAAVIGQQLIPTVLTLANAIRLMLQWFNNLNPSLRKFILYALLALAVLGPMIRYVAGLATAIGVLQVIAVRGALAVWAFGGALWSMATFPFTMIGTGIMAMGSAAFVASAAIGRAFVALPIIMLTAVLKATVITSRAFMVMGIALQVIAAELWFAIQRIWIAGTFALQRVILAASAALGVAWRAMHVMLILITATFTRAIPRLWSTVIFAMAAITTVGGAAIAKLWAAVWFSMQRIVLAGATAAGAIYRAFLAAWMTMTVLFAGGWSKIWIFIASVPGRMVALIGRVIPLLAAALSGPIGWAILAVTSAIIIFYNDLKALFKSIVAYFRTGVQGVGSSASGLVRVFWDAVRGIQRAFFALPKSVRDAMQAVINIVAKAAKAVYNFFSYINPFAHHSPSLVENVTTGMALVSKTFADASSSISASIAQAYRNIKAFGSATAHFVDSVAGIDLNDQRKKLKEFAPGALDEFEALVGSLRTLSGALKGVTDQMNVQQAVVDAWKVQLDAANAALDTQQRLLDILESKASDLSTQLSAAKDELAKFADAPIAGMRAFEDAIFANEMAQKRLRLEMLEFEKANGTVDSLKKKMEGLAGAIELAGGEQNALRSAGAGSEILSQYDDQIRALEQQQTGINDTIKQYDEMSAALEKLQREAERLDLEKSLAFDPLTRQIEQLVKGMNELPFDVILAGVIANKTKVDSLTVAYNAASAAVDAQKKVVDQLKFARDALASTYDVENNKLQAIKDQYDKINTAIQDVKNSMSDMASAADNAKNAMRDQWLTPGAQNFIDAEGGNFPDVGGLSGVGREALDIPDQSKMIDEFTKQLEKDLNDSLASLNPFNWIKEKWNQFTGWWTSTVNPWFGSIFGGISIDTSKFDWLSGVGKKIGEGFTNFGKIIDWVWSKISKMFLPVWDQLKAVWEDMSKKIKDELGPAFDDLKKAFGGSGQFFKNLMTVLGVVVGFLSYVVVGTIKFVATFLIDVFHGVLSGLITIIKGIIKVFTGLVQFVTGVFTGDWSKAWDGIKNIFVGLWNIIWGAIKFVVGGIWGIVYGFVHAIVDFFKWLYDVIVGHSIIPDLVRDVVAWMKSLPGKVMNAIMGLIAMVMQWARNVWNTITTWFKSGWNAVWSWLKTIPSTAYNALFGLIDKVRSLATNAWNTFLNIAKSFVDGKGGLIGFLASIPGRAASALASLGSTVANAVKGAWNGAAGFLNDKVINNINKVTSPFGVKLPTLPKFAKGGVIPGPVSARDNVMIAARTGEGILVPEAVQKFGGARGIAAINRAASGTGKAFGRVADGIQHFEGGGVVGWFKSNVIDKVTGWASKGAGFALEHILQPTGKALREIMPNGFTEDLIVGLINKTVAGAKKWGDKQVSGGTANTGSSGSVSVDAILRTARQFYSGAQISSGLRNSNDYHGRGLAADIVGGGYSGMNKIAQGFYNISGKLLELIHEPSWYVKDGRRVGAGYYASVIGHGPGLEHASHVHVAARADALGYDNGGPLPTGVTMASNSTGKLEWVLTADELDQLAAMGRVISGVMGAVGGRGLKGASIGGSGTLAARGFAVMAATLISIDARLAQIQSRASITQGNMTTTINIGQIVMPNITSGDDAEQLLRNLEALARDR